MLEFIDMDFFTSQVVAVASSISDFSRTYIMYGECDFDDVNGELFQINARCPVRHYCSRLICIMYIVEPWLDVRRVMCDVWQKKRANTRRDVMG